MSKDKFCPNCGLKGAVEVIGEAYAYFGKPSEVGGMWTLTNSKAIPVDICHCDPEKKTHFKGCGTVFYVSQQKGHGKDVQVLP